MHEGEKVEGGLTVHGTRLARRHDVRASPQVHNVVATDTGLVPEGQVVCVNDGPTPRPCRVAHLVGDTKEGAGGLSAPDVSVPVEVD